MLVYEISRSSGDSRRRKNAARPRSVAFRFRIRRGSRERPECSDCKRGLVFVHRVAVRENQNAAEFEQELQGKMPPVAPAIDLRRIL